MDKLILKIKHPVLICCLLMSIISLLATNSVALAASDCAILQLQKNKSPGIHIENNQCENSRGLSLESVIQIPAGARLWLKTKSASPDMSIFQIICQNISATEVKINIDSAFSPWIKPIQLDQCSAWIDQRLACYQSKSNKPVLFCAMAAIKNLASKNVMQRKISVTLRGLKQTQDSQSMAENETVVLRKSVAYIRQEVDLCRKVFKNYHPLTISWMIKANGTVAKLTAHHQIKEKRFIDCTLEAIENHRFPSSEQDSHVTYTF